MKLTKDISISDSVDSLIINHMSMIFLEHCIFNSRMQANWLIETLADCTTQMRCVDAVVQAYEVSIQMKSKQL